VGVRVSQTQEKPYTYFFPKTGHFVALCFSHIDNTPEDCYNGCDAQLEKAVELLKPVELLKALSPSGSRKESGFIPRLA
jgi:hypothetical protein